MRTRHCRGVTLQPFRVDNGLMAVRKGGPEPISPTAPTAVLLEQVLLHTHTDQHLHTDSQMPIHGGTQGRGGACGPIPSPSSSPPLPVRPWQRQTAGICSTTRPASGGHAWPAGWAGPQPGEGGVKNGPVDVVPKLRTLTHIQILHARLPAACQHSPPPGPTPGEQRAAMACQNLHLGGNWWKRETGSCHWDKSRDPPSQD